MRKLAFMLLMLSMCNAQAQMNRIFNRLPSRVHMDEVMFTMREKVNQLRKFETTIPFPLQGDTSFYKLDTLGLHYVDLNADQHLDLIYSGPSDPNGGFSTKIIYANTPSRVFTVLPGKVISIEKQPTKYIMHTLTNPCCDQYTAQVQQYTHSRDTLIRDYTLSIIGSLKSNAVPILNDFPVKSLPSLKLHADQFDFRSTTTDFGEQTDQMHAILRTGQFVEILSLERPVVVQILYTKTIDEQPWHLVMTEVIESAPPSLYESSSVQRMKFVGWTKFD